MRALIKVLLFVSLFASLVGCKTQSSDNTEERNVREQKDTIGFAQYSWQMDSIMARIGDDSWDRLNGEPWLMAICPHDDYSYVGSIYPAVLHNIKSDVVFLIGVAHKAALLGLEDSLIFDTHTHWRAPWKDMKVSDARDELYASLKDNYAMLSDTMHREEHSLEALIPFLQYYNRNVEIVPILVPAMSTERMEVTGKALAKAIRDMADKRDWVWGRDYSIVVTTDAVHYGNEDWGGSDYAKFGCDDKGNEKAREYEKEIISLSLEGEISLEKIRLFSEYTLDPEDYRTYIWTWCGRYCVPLTMYTAFFLDQEKSLNGEYIDYSTSITREHIRVDDLMMGHTAIATDCHWVGYAALGYR